MATEKIGKGTLSRALPRASRYTIFDTQVSGFGLRVFPSGQRSWVFEYRPHPGGASTPKKRVTLGDAGAVGSAALPELTPDAARTEAQRLRSLVTLGGDPMGEKAAAREASTVKDAADRFMRERVGRASPATKEFYRSILDRIILPRLGTKRLNAVTGREVATLHREWQATPYQANRALAVLGSLYSWATKPNVGLAPEGMNPAKGIDRYEEVGHDRVLSTAELERLGATLRLAETVGLPWQLNPEGKAKHRVKDEAARVTVVGPHAIAAIRLLLLTGARLREILHLKWSDVDFDRGLLILRQHKTAKKTGTKAIVLNAPALAVLNGIPRVGVYVIAGDTAGEKDEKPRSDLKRPWDLVRRHAGLSDLRLHDLRHNFAGFGAGGGLGLPIIGKLLGHTQPATTARYAHLDNDPLRRASDTIGAVLSAAMGEPADNEAKANNVLPFGKAQHG